MEDVLQLLRLILDTFLPLYCELAQEPPYEYEFKMAFAGARASTSSEESEKAVASVVVNVSFDRASLLLMTDNEYLDCDSSAA
jgi:hypothetical protein